MTPKAERLSDAVTLYEGDCLDVLPTLAKGSVDAVVTDPPYHGVKDNSWDNQWKTDAEFLTWASEICGLLDKSLAPNGSLYWFASPQMAARVECEIAKTFNVLNQIVWHKGESRGGVAGTGIDVTALRKFWTSSSERVIFAERYGSDKPFGDALIDGNRTYWSACEETKRGIFGDYLRAEFKKAGVTQRQIAALFPSASGGLTGCVSNWLLGYNCPTEKQYESMRQFLNAGQGDGGQYLRREYEDLRRPFRVSARDEWGDVWRFPIERNQVHPTQKPLAMMNHIVSVSSRGGDTILDPFAGSGTTAIAAMQEGRRCILIERDPHYCEIIRRRVREADGAAPGTLFREVARRESLFADEPEPEVATK